MKYQCICQCMITADVPGSLQRLIDQYVYACSWETTSLSKGPGVKTPPNILVGLAKCNTPGRYPHPIFASKAKYPYPL